MQYDSRIFTCACASAEPHLVAVCKALETSGSGKELAQTQLMQRPQLGFLTRMTAVGWLGVQGQRVLLEPVTQGLVEGVWQSEQLIPSLGLQQSAQAPMSSQHRRLRLRWTQAGSGICNGQTKAWTSE